MPELIKDLIKLALIVVAIYFILEMYIRHRWPTWTGSFGKRRGLVVLVLALGAAAIKIAEDAIGGDSGPTDLMILLFVHDHVPVQTIPFFKAMTLAGSWKILLPVATTVTLLLLLTKRRLEAALVAASVISAALAVYLLKTIVGRTRPALWETDWYWGSSFPSGHTLVATALVMSVALCANSLNPRAYKFVLPIAIALAALVGLSRMVLGVHWPTDVMASWCLGTLVPLLVYGALSWHDARTDRNTLPQDEGTFPS